MLFTGDVLLPLDLGSAREVARRLKKGLEPACVSSCPTKALGCQNSHELLSDIKESRMQVLSLEKEYPDA